MAEPRSSVGSSTSGDGGGDRGDPLASTPGPAAAATTLPALVKPSKKRRGRGPRVLRMVGNMFRTMPVLNPKCGRISAAPLFRPAAESRRGLSTGTLVTGTLFGCRKGRVSLSLQESPRCLPTLVVELAIQTQALLREMSSGMVRIAMECEKRHVDVVRAAGGSGRGGRRGSRQLLEEPVWTMFCNGKKTGYGAKREATPEDVRAMELLRPVSMGAGVLPPGESSEAEGPDGEVAYMRANFDHVVASRDSETLYMISPEGNSGPDLTIFFVRI